MNVLFANPTFHPGRNVTCRRPSVKYQDLHLGSELKLCNLDYIERERANVYLLAEFDNIYDIPEIILQKEHDPNCRDHQGLLDELRRVYGEYEFIDPVIVIGFEV